MTDKSQCIKNVSWFGEIAFWHTSEILTKASRQCSLLWGYCGSGEQRKSQMDSFNRQGIWNLRSFRNPPKCTWLVRDKAGHSLWSSFHHTQQGSVRKWETITETEEERVNSEPEWEHWDWDEELSVQDQIHYLCNTELVCGFCRLQSGSGTMNQGCRFVSEDCSRVVPVFDCTVIQTGAELNHKVHADCLACDWWSMKESSIINLCLCACVCARACVCVCVWVH